MPEKAVWAVSVVQEVDVVVTKSWAPIMAPLLALLVSSCQVQENSTSPGAAACASPPAAMFADFENNVNPVILGQCISCHAPSGVARRLSFTTSSSRDNFCVAYIMGPSNAQRALSTYPRTQAHEKAGGGIFTEAQIPEIITWVNRYAK
jgi:hypothetical protein